MLFFFLYTLCKISMDDEMLIRFIKRQCSSSEARKILLWIEMNEENKAHFTQLQSLWASADICFAVQNDKVDSEGTIKRLASIVKKFKLKINDPIE